MMNKLFLTLLFIGHSATGATFFLDSFEAGLLAPENLLLTQVSESSLSLGWQKQKEINSFYLCYADKSFSAISYSTEIRQKLADFSKKHNGDCLITYSNNVKINQLVKANYYYIVVLATKKNQVSNLSKELKVNTDLSPPTLIRAKSLDASKSQIIWKDNPDATSYNLYISEKPFVFNSVKDREAKELNKFIVQSNGQVYSGIRQGISSVIVSRLTPSKEYYYVLTSLLDDVEGYASKMKTLTALGAMNDTGVTLLETFLVNENRKCDSHSLGNQDCNHGRDSSSKDNKDGVAGFSFTKIKSDGENLTVDASEWSCVKDNVTGLVWEVKTARSANQTYTQYLSAYGSQFDLNENRYDGGDDRVWAGPSTSNSTQEYIDKKNKQKLCKVTDWRLPTREELRSIIHYGQSTKNSNGKLVLIDLDYFPNAQPNDYWTSSPVADDHLSSWTVYFANGSDHPRARDSKRRIRLVYGNQ